MRKFSSIGNCVFLLHCVLKLRDFWMLFAPVAILIGRKLDHNEDGEKNLRRYPPLPCSVKTVRDGNFFLRTAPAVFRDSMLKLNFNQ
jgi:hypothetical protein